MSHPHIPLWFVWCVFHLIKLYQGRKMTVINFPIKTSVFQTTVIHFIFIIYYSIVVLEALFTVKLAFHSTLAYCNVQLAAWELGLAPPSCLHLAGIGRQGMPSSGIEVDGELFGCKGNWGSSAQG